MTPTAAFALFSALALFALYFYPLGVLVARAGAAAEAPFFWRVFAFTYGQAFVSAGLSAVVGITGALIYSENRFPGRRLFWRLGLVPFSFPTILAALGFVGFWGNVFGLPAILAVHVFFNFPLFLKMVGTALVETDRATEMAALSLGASRAHAFFNVTLPKIAPAIRSAFVLSFLYCAASFLVVLLLGGGPHFTTLEVAIAGAIKMDFNPALAVRYATAELAVGLVVYLVFLPRPRPSVAVVGEPPPLYRVPAAMAIVYAIAIAILVGGPVASLFHPARLDWAELWHAARTSAGIAVTVAVISVVLAFPLAYLERRGFRAAGVVSGLPLAVSSLVLTLAVLLAYHVDWIGVVIVQSTLALPLVFRPIRDALFRVPDNLLMVGRSLGAGPWRLLVDVELPLARRALVLGATFAAALSLGEVGSLLVFLAPDRNPLPLWIYRLMAQYHFEEAYPVGLALMVFSGVIYYLGAKLEG